MYKTYIFVTLVFLSLTMGLTISGCSWIAIADTSYCKDNEGYSQITEELRMLALKYKGSSKSQIQNDLGRPNRIIKKGRILILNDEECLKNWEGVLRWGDCEAGNADEVWEYRYKKRDKCGWVFYGSRFYILDGKAVDIR